MILMITTTITIQVVSVVSIPTFMMVGRIMTPISQICIGMIIVQQVGVAVSI